MAAMESGFSGGFGVSSFSEFWVVQILGILGPLALEITRMDKRAMDLSRSQINCVL